jgi:hypothetical protein
VHRVTLEAALRARAAAYGARRLLRPAMQEALDGGELTPSLRQFVDDLDDCSAATMRVAAALAAGCLGRKDLLPLAVSTLARMNLRLWEPQGTASIAQRLILVDHLEDELEARIVHAEEGRLGGSRRSAASGVLTTKQSPVDIAVDAALAVTDRSALCALHVLLAVALRALSETV